MKVYAIKKVKAQVFPVFVEPDYRYVATCPYCQEVMHDEIFEENCTLKVICRYCLKDFKIKIPKFY